MNNLESPKPFSSIEEVISRLGREGYLLERSLATTAYLATALQKPLFLEGEPGVGKTELAKAMASALGADLIRMQCYEGLETSTALYEWNYPRQMLEIRLEEARGVDKQRIGRNIFSEEFLLKRPLLQAIMVEPPQQAVLLIDEVDRSDEEFEAFLLELLSDYQISIPEIGTVKARRPPIVVLTSNRTRELHDALKRRCLYCWIDYPNYAKELAIVQTRVPGIQERLARQVCSFMQWLREQDLYRHPGVSETVDWAWALLTLGLHELDADAVEQTLGSIVKYKRDLATLHELNVPATVARITTAGNHGKSSQVSN